jgi:hypothetical protein
MKEVLAGWFKVFPELTGYQRSFLAPVVKSKQVYQQTARYLWTGGAVKLLEVTLARDPVFKKQYAADTLKKQANAPQEVKVGKRAAWLWNLEKEAGTDPNKVRTRLVLPLAEDKVIVFEAKGRGPWEALTGLAEKFDQAAVEKALGKAPRTDSKRELALFRELRKGTPYADVVPWVGMADRDVGSGMHVLVYDLPDGSRVSLGYADFQKLMYARHEDKDGRTTELAE